ncbi:MAG: histidinol dehydrogenase [Muribaculaceae bacterium]|nr:histidinol dehydrogenase [Muribaculaceae bacterium]
MKIFVNPGKEQWKELCLRAKQSESKQVEEIVLKILDRVKLDGDKALAELSLEIDKREVVGGFQVTEKELNEACERLSEALKAAIETAVKNISSFHRAQLPKEITVETTEDVVCIQRPVAIQKVGIYIPGGTAPLFSTVLMLALPAKIAGCKEVVMCTPCDRDGKVADAVLYAARRCGVDKIFKIGGAQAIGAMAFGTESVPQVNKIFGPGNRYVTMAKQLVGSTTVAIDMPAGPSEVMIVADETCCPEFVAADLLSQCEHGADSQGIVVCDSEKLANKIADAIEVQAAELPRDEYVLKSLANSRIIVLYSRAEMIKFANIYGAEHLILSISDGMKAVDDITAAGSVFVGNYSPESAGDYASGTNHTLPTSGWAHSYSGVNIDSFMRKMTIQNISASGLRGLSYTIIKMAEAEGLAAHANAVKIRLENEE